MFKLHTEICPFRVPCFIYLSLHNPTKRDSHASTHIFDTSCKRELHLVLNYNDHFTPNNIPFKVFLFHILL